MAVPGINQITDNYNPEKKGVDPDLRNDLQSRIKLLE